jgi:UDP-N-acetylglucosamine diphosphorylase / glucose-1-phosphate thymidylyltransferase / UDP-N-acetylgalactosamine diphosphorylase / glucosamine-1-phosphate N-acetyltransferase / galactosamine-1-phosphate N-acetyltransferase
MVLNKAIETTIYTMNVILFDDASIRPHLLPLTFTRPVAGLRCGIMTIAEKWAHHFACTPSFATEPYLQAKFPIKTTVDNIFVNGALCPNLSLNQAIQNLQINQVLQQNETVLAYRAAALADTMTDFEQIDFNEPCTIIKHLWDIFVENGAQITADFHKITANKTTKVLNDPHTRNYAPQNIFLEEGASVRASILNAEGGPIYIGKNATVAEGSVIIGPFALGEGATVNWGSKMRANTTIGPHCKVGGEVSNAVLMGYSNKAHDGFLGNAVLGEWCNLGANVNNSNLKNDYSPVKLYNYATAQLENTEHLFCGLFVGDYTKAGISTAFNTGTVVGVCANVFGAGFQDKHIPSFMWGGAAEGYTNYRLEKALEVIHQTVARRGKVFDEVDELIVRHLQKNIVDK